MKRYNRNRWKQETREMLESPTLSKPEFEESFYYAYTPPTPYEMDPQKYEEFLRGLAKRQGYFLTMGQSSPRFLRKDGTVDYERFEEFIQERLEEKNRYEESYWQSLDYDSMHDDLGGFDFEYPQLGEGT